MVRDSPECSIRISVKLAITPIAEEARHVEGQCEYGLACQDEAQHEHEAVK